MNIESEFRSRFWKSVKFWSKRFPNTKHPITLAAALFRVSWGLKGHPVRDNIVKSKEWVMSQISQILIAFIIDTKMPLVVVCIITNITCLFENKAKHYESLCTEKNCMKMLKKTKTFCVRQKKEQHSDDWNNIRVSKMAVFF